MRIVSVLILIYSFTSLYHEAISQEGTPNIVLILVDDLGWNDVSYMGSQFNKTPNIDSLSYNSFNYNQAYASASICSPSRASILTGKHPVELNITDWIPGQNPPNRILKTPEDASELALKEVTIAERLKEKNYQTYFVGKWHLGGEGFEPEKHGFDVNIAGLDKGSPPGGYFSPYNNPKLKDGPEGEYLTDRLTNESIKLMSKATKPFFLMLSFYNVHTPIQANPKFITSFQNHIEPVTEEYKNNITRKNQSNPAYASMIAAVDFNVGKLVDFLKKSQQWDNTIIIFTSDNGGLSTLEKGRGTAPTSNDPLRCGKGWLYEGGIRIPLLVKPAKHLEHTKEINVPVIGSDIYHTLVGDSQSSNNPNLLDPSNLDQKRTLVWHYPHYHGSGWTPGAAYRKGDHKIIYFYEDQSLELYDLLKDPREMNNLAKTKPSLASSLLTELFKWQESFGAQAPSMN